MMRGRKGADAKMGMTGKQWVGVWGKWMSQRWTRGDRLVGCALFSFDEWVDELEDSFLLSPATLVVTTTRVLEVAFPLFLVGTSSSDVDVVVVVDPFDCFAVRPRLTAAAAAFVATAGFSRSSCAATAAAMAGKRDFPTPF